MTRHHKQREEPTWTKRLEELAANIVAQKSGVRAESHDIRGAGADSGRADFTLHSATGECVGLLEVTSVTDPAMNRTLSSLEKRMARRLPNSRFYWSITLNSSVVKVTELRTRLPEILTELERTIFANSTDHGTVFIENPNKQAAIANGIPDNLNNELYELGVQSIAATTEVDPEHLGYIARATTSGLESVGADAVIVAVDRELAKADNQTKLRKAGANHRAELFVWLDSPHLRIVAFHALADDALEVEKLVGRPNLPGGVTAVWVSPTPIKGNNGRYLYSDGGPWKSGSWMTGLSD